MLCNSTLKVGTRVSGQGGVWVIEDLAVSYNSLRECWDTFATIAREDGHARDNIRLSGLLNSIESGSVEILENVS